MIATVLTVAVLAVTAACSSGDGDDPGAGARTVSETTDAQRGGEIVVGLESESAGFLPGQSALTPASTNVVRAVFDTLMARTEDGGTEPDLAESLDPNGALTEWRLRLRPGVTFHDGTPLDADALREIFDQYLTDPGSTTAGALDGVQLRVDDELTVTYLLDEPNAGFPDLLTDAPGMPFSVQAASEAGADAGARPVGTGPFRFERWERDTELVVVRNESYWRDGLPHLDRITFRPVPDEHERAQGLLNGDLDAIQSLRGRIITSMLSAEEQGRPLEVHTFIGDDAGISFMNVLEPPFDDLRIRRAFAHTVDQEWVADVLGDVGLVDLANQYFGLDSPWYSQRAADARASYDMDAARRLVQEYVDDPARSDGQPVGTPPRLVYQCVDEPILRDLSRLTQHAAEEAGFEVELVAMDQGQLVAGATGSPFTDPPYRGDFMVTCYRTIPAGGPYATLAAAFGPPDRTPSNLSNFHTDQLAELLDRLRSTRDLQEQRALVEEIGVLINENAPLSYGTATPAMVAVRRGVHGVGSATLPDGTRTEGVRRAIARWGEVWTEDGGEDQS
jgi:peptide/nickel transport system substrate-binding protein